MNKKEVYGNFAVIANSGLLLTYSLPLELGSLKKGTLCLVPLRRQKSKKTVVAVFLNYCEKPSFACVDIENVCDLQIHFNAQHIALMEWISEYYVTPIAQAISHMAPGFIWNEGKHADLKKRVLQLEKEKEKPIKGEIVLEKKTEINLNFEQNLAYTQILSQGAATTLLYGVTGSGKTEVYLKLAQTVLARGKKVLILVPEIALTPQMSARFRSFFGEQLCVLHSGLTQVEYMREWLKAYYQKANVMLGVRTAIFSPFTNIGLIVVDEEHDASYKCSEMPCYHSRDVAVVRAKMEGAMCVLGSATPSLESFHNAKNKKYFLAQMKERFSLNQVGASVIDAKEELDLKKNYTTQKYLRSSAIEFDDSGLGPSVVTALKSNKDNHQQSIVLLNRRGYVNYALCSACATPLTCPKCSVSTTLHKRGEIEVCHYCNFTTPTRKACLKCGAQSFLLKGMGTQNIEEKLQKNLPLLRISRLDRDVLTSNSRLTQIIDDFRKGDIDCLIGTQLLAKGHDFPKVTLVIILHVEDSLFLPDFRSAERTFQLITQAMGRAGRGEIPGQVMLQSFILNHPVIEKSLRADFEGFYESEIQVREMTWQPPFCRQILFEIQHSKLEKSQELSEKLRVMLVDFWKEHKYSSSDIRIAGPYQAAVGKIRENYRTQICVSFARNLHPKNVVPGNLWQEKEFVHTLNVDVDPLSFM